MHTLYEEVLTSQEVAPISLTGGATANGAGVDMKGWDGVLFVVEVGVMTATATLDGKLQHDSVSNFASPTDHAPTLTQLLAASGGSKEYVLNLKAELLAAGERYVRLVLTQATAAVVVGATAIRYRRSGGLPPTQAATQTVEITS